MPIIPELTLQMHHIYQHCIIRDEGVVEQLLNVELAATGMKSTCLPRSNLNGLNEEVYNDSRFVPLPLVMGRIATPSGLTIVLPLVASVARGSKPTWSRHATAGQGSGNHGKSLEWVINESCLDMCVLLCVRVVFDYAPLCTDVVECKLLQ